VPTVRVQGERDLRYGPERRAARVRDVAGPRSTYDPGGGVTFTTRADLASKIAANPVGTIFVHAAGGTVDWDAGVDCTKNPKIYWLGMAGVDSTVIDGGARQIIGFDAAQTSPWEMHGGVFQNFGNTDATTSTPFITRDGTIVSDFICRNNFQAGFESQGSNVLAQYATLLSNGRYGMSGTSATTTTGSIWEHIRCEDNNTRHLGPGGNAGGTKFTQRVGASTVRYWYCLNNYGFGIWADFATVESAGGFQVLENVVENNLRAGIFMEGVSSGCNAQRNYLRGNGLGDGTWPPTDTNGWQLQVITSDGTLNGSSGIDISYNDIDGSSRLLAIVNHDFHPNDTKAVNVHHNRFWLRGSGMQVGGHDEQATKTLWTEGTNDFDYNEYHVADLANSNWRWDSGSGSGVAKTWAQWQALGFDVNGARVLI
jgi:hypothetical protein